MTSFDAIVIGAGHNGLTAATLLAKQGRRVLLLEADSSIGGLARTVEFLPGFRTSGVGHLVNRLDPDVVSALGLAPAVTRGPALPTVALSATGDHAILRGAYGETIEGVAGDQVKAFASLRDKLLFQSGLLARFMKRPPPEIGAVGAGDLASFGLAGIALLKRGREEARDVLRMLLMNVADVADEYLDDDRLKGVLAFDATLGSHLGPRSPTSLLGLYYRLTGAANGRRGEQYLPAGGMGRVAEAFRQAAERAGVTIRTGAPVARILSDRGVATGVVLASGETLAATTIVSALHPKTTLLKLVAPGEIDTGLVRSMTSLRSKGNVAKLHLALDRVPRFAGLAASDHVARLVIARSVSHVENAFNPAKYGEFSRDPVMEITLPSLSDPTLAPSGACTLSALVEFAPYDLKGGWDEGKPAFEAIICETLERHAPGIGASILASELLTPLDLERRYHLPGGHWHHGEMQPDQLLVNRPVHAVSRYETPLAGLFLASAGSHPGGGISGLPGLLAARHILAKARP